jgi:serine protease Do
MDDSNVSRRRLLAGCASALAAGTAGCSGSPFGGTGGEDGGGSGNPNPVDPRTAAGADGGGGDFQRFDQDVDDSHAAVYQDVIDSVSQIRVYNSQGTGNGTGFVYNEDYVVTNEHVVAGADDVFVRFRDGGWTEVSVVGTDRHSDLAVLSTPERPDSATPLPLRGSDPEVGTRVVAIGNPFGFSGSVSSGIVSGVDRSLRPDSSSDFSIPDAIQTDAPVNPGNSGGPLVTLDGDVAGVINSGGGDNIGFAISASLTRRVVPALVDDGEFRHSYMGVRLADVGPRIAQANDIDRGWGVYIAHVYDGGPSDGALRASTDDTRINGRSVETGGDVVVRMEDTEIGTSNALASFLALETSPGDTIDVTVLRDGREQTVDLTLGAREDASI